jgi:glutathione S-transferase
VSVIEPGAVWTEFGHNVPEEALRERRASLDALTADDVAHLSTPSRSIRVSWSRRSSYGLSSKSPPNEGRSLGAGSSQCLGVFCDCSHRWSSSDAGSHAVSHTLKLYHATNSPNSRRVRIFLAEKGLELTLVPVDLGAGEQHSEAYRTINPRRVVPALVLEDGTTIGEVPAIMRYLDEAFPETPLLGATPKDKGLVAMWERRAELEGFAAVMEGVRNKSARLKGRSIAGEQFSAADITALVTIDFANALDISVPDGHRALTRWYAAVSARPSAST